MKLFLNPKIKDPNKDNELNKFVNKLKIKENENELNKFNITIEF